MAIGFLALVGLANACEFGTEFLACIVGADQTDLFIGESKLFWFELNFEPGWFCVSRSIWTCSKDWILILLIRIACIFEVASRDGTLFGGGEEVRGICVAIDTIPASVQLG